MKKITTLSIVFANRHPKILDCLYSFNLGTLFWKLLIIPVYYVYVDTAWEKPIRIICVWIIFAIVFCSVMWFRTLWKQCYYPKRIMLKRLQKMINQKFNKVCFTFSETMYLFCDYILFLVLVTVLIGLSQQNELWPFGVTAILYIIFFEFLTIQQKT